MGSDRNLNTRVVGVDPKKSSERHSSGINICALARVWPRRWNEGCADQAEAIGEIWNSFMRSRVLAFISSDQKYVENVLATFYELVVCILRVEE